MDRILKGTSATISVTFYVDGAAIDPTPDSATIEILREDGTVLVAAGTSAADAGTGKFTFSLTPSAHTAQYDLLRCRWTASLGGQPQTIETFVEIVGGHLFSIPYARKLKPLGNETKYPTEELVQVRVLAETALEDACGVAFVPRYAREKFDGDGTTELLTRPRPLSIISASVGGAALTAPELAKLELYPDGRVYRPAGWPCGRRNIELKYVHGYEAPPPRVGRAARSLASWGLVESPINERTSALRSEELGTTEFFVTAGMRDAVFDLPEANAVVTAYGVRALVG